MGCAGLPYFIQGEISRNLNISGAIPLPRAVWAGAEWGGWWPGCAGVRGGSPHRWATPLLGRGAGRGRRVVGVAPLARVLRRFRPVLSFRSRGGARGARLAA